MKITLLFLLFALQAGAQQFVPYYKTDSLEIKEYIEKSSQQLSQHLTPPPDCGRDFKKDLEDYIKEDRSFISEVMKNDLLQDTVLVPYVNKVFKKILDANPFVGNQRCFITVNSEPNAFALGEGTVLIHVGMIARMENEGELAYVLCHELSHNYLDHMNRKVMKVLTATHEKQFKKDLRKASHSEYNTYEKVTEVLSKLSFQKLHHSRETELQADSMGMILLVKAGYKVEDGLRQLTLLDSVDEPMYKTNIDFKTNFDCKDFQYMDSWSEYHPKKAWEAQDDRSEAMKDSLKTHPDCKKRIEYMRIYFNMKNADVSGTFGRFSSPAYEPFRKRAEFEVVQSGFERKQYDESLYLSLQLINSNPQCDYIRAMVALSICKIHEYEKDHKMQQVVEMPDTRFNESYNRLLVLLQNLSLSDLAGLPYCHLKNYQPANPESEYFLAAQYAAASLNDKKEEMNAAKNRYVKLYPKGKFISIMNPSEINDKSKHTKTK